jgi:hypothetical protein
VLSLQHHRGGGFDSVDVSIEGGTSASAPEVAAASAVLMQVAQLSGHTFHSATDVRQFLMTHANPVPNLPQSDETINVGPQIDLTKAVEAAMGRQITPAVPRVAIEQRRNYANLDAVFLSATDPSNIDLSGANETSWITIAPDWEGLSGGNYTYSLYVAGKPAQKLATTSSARLLPAQILAAAGMPLASSSSRTVNLTYAALNGSKVLTQTTFALTFGPAAAQTTNVLAPIVPPLVTGTTIPVAYDLTNASYTGTPSIVVSEPGRFDPATGNVFHPSYVAPLPGGVLKGTVNIPVSALQGGGVYGIGIAFGSTTFKVGYPTPPMTDFAFTRVAGAPSSLRPVAPLLSYNGSTSGHFLEVPYNGSFQLSYDVRNVTGATGAIVEISAAGPTEFGTYNPFNNPNGTIPDHNGVDTGSIYTATLSGTNGTVTINGVAANLVPTLEEVVRVIPMRGGVAAGEAGDVSFITMDGVLAADGGYIDLGYGINSSGTDGFITSDQQLATGEVIGSVETFDQVKNSIVQNVQSADGTVFRTYGNGIFGNDLGFFVTDLNSPPWTEAGNFLNPVAAGTLGGTWTSPSSSFYLQEVAANQASDVAAFLAQDYSAPFNDNMRLFTSNLTANTSSTTADLSLPLQGKMNYPTFAHIAENTSTNQAAIVVSDYGNWCGSPILETVDLGTLAVSSFQGIGSGLTFGLDVDPSTNKAAVTTLCDFGLSIYDLGTKTGTEVALPGDNAMFGVFSGGEVTADAVAHEFLVVQQVSADAETNNNSLGSILVYDENGRLLKTLERFALAGAFMPLSMDNLQVNPSRHMGYFLGANGQELEPFSY